MRLDRVTHSGRGGTAAKPLAAKPLSSPPAGGPWVSVGEQSRVNCRERRRLSEWNQAWGAPDEALAMDGKTMKNAVDGEGRQTHIMSVIGHESKHCYAQKQ